MNNISMMKKTMGLAVIAAFLFMGLGTGAYAFGPGRFCGGPCGFGPDGFGPGALKCLDLTADQKKQITGILEKYQPQIDQAMTEIRKLHEQALEAGQGNEFNEEQVRVKFRETMPTFEDLFVLKAKIRNEIQSTLTEDQIRELREKRDRWIDKRKDCMKFGKRTTNNTATH